MLSFMTEAPVDSTAVKASLERSLASPTRDFSPGLARHHRDRCTPRPHELVIRLRTRSTFLLDDLGVSISKPSSGRAGSRHWPVRHQFDVCDRSRDEGLFRITIGAVPNIDQIVWKSYPTVRTAWAAMMRGEIDFLYEVGTGRAWNSCGVKLRSRTSPFSETMSHGVIFNSRRPIFRDSRVRRALNYAVDRSVIIDQAVQRHVEFLPPDPAWPQHWAFDASLPSIRLRPCEGHWHYWMPPD